MFPRLNPLEIEHNQHRRPFPHYIRDGLIVMDGNTVLKFDRPKIAFLRQLI